MTDNPIFPAELYINKEAYKNVKRLQDDKPRIAEALVFYPYLGDESEKPKGYGYIFFPGDGNLTHYNQFIEDVKSGQFGDDQHPMTTKDAPNTNVANFPLSLVEGKNKANIDAPQDIKLKALRFDNINVSEIETLLQASANKLEKNNHHTWERTHIVTSATPAEDLTRIHQEFLDALRGARKEKSDVMQAGIQVSTATTARTVSTSPGAKKGK